MGSLKADPPFFSVIVPDYEGTVPRAYLRRCLQALRDQTLQDFEVLLLHDGPKLTPYTEDLAGVDLPERVRTTVTEQRKNDFGHSLRDMGLRQAHGRYIVHCNADNFLYPQALQRVRETLTGTPRLLRFNGKVVNTDNVAVFSILMHGMTCAGKMLLRVAGKNEDFALILTGAPAAPKTIDCMQLVMKRQLWLDEGGWYDKSEESDGVLYARFVEKYGARYIPEVLGEHW